MECDTLEDVAAYFSPLFIGEITSTPRFFSARPRFQLFQSPLHRGNHFNDGLNRAVVSQTKISVPSSSGKSLQPEAVSGAEMICEPFQSPLHRGNHFNALLLREKILRRIISVPSSSGKSLQPRPEYSFRYIPDNFSPLFIGEITSTTTLMPFCCGSANFSPLFIGEITSTWRFRCSSVRVY